MTLRCGIVGLPNVGKSTLFNCLTNAKAQAANYPFCTIDANIGKITVPDDRLIKLDELLQPKRNIPTTIDIVDIAGLVKGASKGEGLGNQFLANIRETDAIINILRCFDDDNIVHVDGSINPVRDKEIIDTELQLKDLETIEKRIYQLTKIAKSNDKEAKKGLEILEVCKKHLETAKSIRTLLFDNENDKKHIADLFLLTEKPVMYVCNTDENAVVRGNRYVEAVKEAIKNEDAEMLIIAAAVEAEIAQLDAYEDRLEFLKEIGLKEPGLNKLIKSAYHLLDLITFFTASPSEVKAWTITKGTKTPQAAGTIHTDFERGFIKAEVIKYDDFVKYGSEQSCRDAGKIFIEGKDYVVKDGDLIHFRFNV